MIVAAVPARGPFAGSVAAPPSKSHTNRALILEGIIWSAVAVLCTTLLARAWFGRACGLVAGALLACTVGFWGYGEVAYPYVALAGETALLAWLANATLQGQRSRVVWMGLAWGISAGVRWDWSHFGCW